MLNGDTFRLWARGLVLAGVVFTHFGASAIDLCDLGMQTHGRSTAMVALLRMAIDCGGLKAEQIQAWRAGTLSDAELLHSVPGNTECLAVKQGLEKIVAVVPADQRGAVDAFLVDLGVNAGIAANAREDTADVISPFFILDETPARDPKGATFTNWIDAGATGQFLVSYWESDKRLAIYGFDGTNELHETNWILADIGFESTQLVRGTVVDGQPAAVIMSKDAIFLVKRGDPKVQKIALPPPAPLPAPTASPSPLWRKLIGRPLPPPAPYPVGATRPYKMAVTGHWMVVQTSERSILVYDLRTGRLQSTIANPYSDHLWAEQTAGGRLIVAMGQGQDVNVYYPLESVQPAASYHVNSRILNMNVALDAQQRPWIAIAVDHNSMHATNQVDIVIATPISGKTIPAMTAAVIDPVKNSQPWHLDAKGKLRYQVGAYFNSEIKYVGPLPGLDGNYWHQLVTFDVEGDGISKYRHLKVDNNFRFTGWTAGAEPNGPTITVHNDREIYLLNPDTMGRASPSIRTRGDGTATDGVTMSNGTTLAMVKTEDFEIGLLDFADSRNFLWKDPRGWNTKFAPWKIFPDGRIALALASHQINPGSALHAIILTSRLHNP